MRIPAVPTLWLQGLHRSYKLAILLIAAWAPVILPRRPFMAAGIVLIGTALFLMATRALGYPEVTQARRAMPFDTHS